MTRETDLVEQFLINTSFLNKGEVKFLPIKQNNIRQKCCQKHEKRCSKWLRTYEVWHPFPLYAAVRILIDLPDDPSKFSRG